MRCDLIRSVYMMTSLLIFFSVSIFVCYCVSALNKSAMLVYVLCTYMGAAITQSRYNRASRVVEGALTSKVRTSLAPSSCIFIPYCGDEVLQKMVIPQSIQTV